MRRIVQFLNCLTFCPCIFILNVILQVTACFGAPGSALALFPKNRSTGAPPCRALAQLNHWLFNTIRKKLHGTGPREYSYNIVMYAFNLTFETCNIVFHESYT